MAESSEAVAPNPAFAPPKSLDEARALARQRFKERLEQGQQIGNCECHDESAAETESVDGSSRRLVGVRFLDSGRTFYFDPGERALEIGDWVVAETTRGKEAGRVVIAPHQVRLNMLQGEVKPVARTLTDADIEKMQRLKKDAASAVKTFGAKIREHGLPMKPISADYSFDGSHLTLNFSSPERIDFRDLVRDLASTFHCRVELKQVGPRDEARLLGGLGRCGRTLCCSSWLPVYPEISMNMAKTQDLPLNPSKVSGVCGRLLCCLSYENDQYKQMKAIMPRLGQSIDTPNGPGQVISLQILKELVTVRLDEDRTEHVFSSVDLGFRQAEAAPRAAQIQPQEPAAPDIENRNDAGETDEAATPSPSGDQAGNRRRRRRNRQGKRRRNTED
ncbi:MAG TPA: regulatory iron-sulfur-containing complex subunit RicT [Thermomicrobiales bacterium]|nr:regulatory iron-sulfur-containing complex subunit RicT [Thermomicrobiales bacterium]